MSLDQDIPLEQVDSLLTRLRAIADTVSENLTELDADPTLLALSTRSLSGLTLARWSTAKDAYALLWPWYYAINQVLSAAEAIRRSRRISRDERLQIFSLLTTDSVELSTSVVPLSRRSLLAPAASTLKCTPDELFSEMDQTFSRLRAVLADVEAKETLLAELTTLTASLSSLPATPAIRRLTDDVALVQSRATSDPLSLAETDVASLLARLQAVRDEAARLHAVEVDLSQYLREATRLLNTLDLTHKALLATAQETKKLASPPTTPIPTYLPLVTELASIRALAAASQTLHAASRLVAWHASAAALLTQMQDVEATLKAPLAELSELRGLLGAYQAKTAAKARSEDPTLTRLYQSAKDLLYTAPCDLAAARAALETYARAL